MSDCRHVPPCGVHGTRFVCGQRTRLEDAVKRGLVTRASAEALLRKYHVPISPVSKVYAGQVETDRTQRSLL